MGCVEYRFDRLPGQDRYIGWVTTRPKLDPKLGSKTKMHFGIPGRTQPYIGGNYSRKRLTMNFGVIQYLSDNASVEIGYRFLLDTIQQDRWSDRTGRVDWHNNDLDDMIYFGGVIRF